MAKSEEIEMINFSRIKERAKYNYRIYTLKKKIIRFLISKVINERNKLFTLKPISYYHAKQMSVIDIEVSMLTEQDSIRKLDCMYYKINNMISDML